VAFKTSLSRQIAKNTVPNDGLRTLDHLPSWDYVPVAPPPQSALMAQDMQQLEGNPTPQFHTPIFRLTPGQEHDGREVMTHLQAVARWPHIRNRAGRMAYIVGPRGEVLNQALIATEEMLKGIRVQEAHLAAIAAQYDNGLRDPTSIHPAAQSPETRRTEFNDTHSAESRLTRFRPVQSANFKMYEEAARRRLHPNDFIASAPGSRMPSRHSSIESAPELPVPTYLPPNGQFGGMNTTSQTMKGHVARELTQPAS
jgi:hypothetical protein